ncbi:WD40 repeat domain-containing protein [Streptomyces sp. NPDC003691]
MSDDTNPHVPGTDSAVPAPEVDPGVLVHADPARVTALLDTVPGPAGRLAAAVYRQSAHLHRDAGARVRRGLLALDAARYGAPGRAARLAAVPVPGDGGPEWRVAWATGSEVSPRLLATLAGHERPLSAVVTATTPDGRAVAVTGGPAEPTVRVWDLATGEQTEMWRPHSADVWSLATAEADGRPVVVTGGYDGTIQLWDPAGGPPVGRVDSGPFPGIPGGPGCPPDGVWYPGVFVNSLASAVLDGRPVLVFTVQTDDGDADACHDFPVTEVHELATGRRIAGIHTGHRGAVHLASTVLDGRPALLTRTLLEPSVRLWDLATGQPAGTLAGHTGGVTAMTATVLDGRPVVVTGSSDGTVRRWDLSTRRPIGDPLAGRARHLDTALLDGRPVVAVLTADGTVRIRDLATGRAVAEPFTARGARALATAVAGGRPVAVTAMDDATVRVWDLAPRPPVGSPAPGHSGPVRAAAVMEAGGRPVVLTADDGALHRRDLATGRPAGPPLVMAEGGAGAVAVAAATVAGCPTAVAVGPRAVGAGRAGARRVGARAELRGTVRRWDLVTGAPVGVPATGIPDAYAVATAVVNGRPVAVTGGPAAVGGYAGELRRWDLITGQQTGAPLTGHGWAVQAVATTVLGGRPVAVSAGGRDGTLRVWDLATGRRTGAPLTGHTGRVGAVATAVVDGCPVAVSGGEDRTVRLWDLDARERIGSALVFPAAVGALAVAPGGLIVCFGSEAAFLRGPVSPSGTPG